jgi:hypothetical protein
MGIVRCLRLFAAVSGAVCRRFESCQARSHFAFPMSRPLKSDVAELNSSVFSSSAAPT